MTSDLSQVARQRPLTARATCMAKYLPRVHVVLEAIVSEKNKHLNHKMENLSSGNTNSNWIDRVVIKFAPKFSFATPTLSTF